MKHKILIVVTILVMLVYFLLATPVMMDDGFHYEGFAESLAKGKLDFKSYYGFQGLSFFAAITHLITKSDISIIITSAIFSLLSIPLAYLVGKNYYQNKQAGVYYLILFLLASYPYTTMMRGFQEAALLFFILLIIYGSLNKKAWAPVAWAVGGMVKPFALTLFPLFIKNIFSQQFSSKIMRPHNFRAVVWLMAGLILGGLYLGTSYYQTGRLINNAAVGSYQGNFDIGNSPPLGESFSFDLKGYARAGANLLLSFRKIMISPLVILFGGFALLLNKSLRLRKEIILAIILNFLLVGSLSFSFSKYLLPMTTLFALASVSYLLKHKWLIALVFIDSLFVFLPIWNHFGHNFWNNIWIYMLPLYYSILIFILYESAFIKLKKIPSFSNERK